MTDKLTILVVEDEISQAEILCYNLRSEGYEVLTADNGDDALHLARDDAPDLILLDWMLPNVSGVEVCRQLKSRSDTQNIPIIMLSARSEEADRVRGLDTGADDYVTKPYSMPELFARVRTQLRRTRAASVGEVIEVNDLKLDLASHRAYRAQSELNLGPTEFRLLKTFMERPGRVWSREQLLDRVWGRDVYVDSRTVDVHVGRLRKALNVVPTMEDPIRTVRGAGYSLG